MLLTQLAWDVVQNSRKACGAHDELTSEVTSLHIVLRRLEVEVSKPNSILSRSDDGGDRREELAQLSGDCKRVLRVLDGILAKYNALSEEKRSVTRLWKKVQFGNGEMLDLAELRLKMTTSTSALTLFLNLLSIGSQGKVESYMESQGDELKEMRRSLNWITAEMQAKAPKAGEGSILTTYAGDDKAIWKDFRRELIKDGFSSEVLERHKETIKDYVMELGSRGALDDLEDDMANVDLFSVDLAASDGRQCITERGELGSSEACLSEESTESSEEIVNKSENTHVSTEQLSPRENFQFQGDELKELRRSLNCIMASMQAKAPKAGEGSVLTTNAEDDKAIWKEFRRQLIKEGFSSEELQRHKEFIKAYVMEYAGHGAFDDVDDDLGRFNSALQHKRTNYELKSISGANKAGHRDHGPVERQEESEEQSVIGLNMRAETTSLQVPGQETDQEPEDTEAENNISDVESQQETELCNSDEASEKNLETYSVDDTTTEPLHSVHDQCEPAASLGAAQHNQGGSILKDKNATIEAEILEDLNTLVLGDDEVEATQIGTAKGIGSISGAVRASETHISSSPLGPVDDVQFTYTAFSYINAISKLVPKWFGPYERRGLSLETLLFITGDPLFYNGTPYSSNVGGTWYRPHPLCHWLQSLANHYEQAQLSSASIPIPPGTLSSFANEVQLLVGRLCAYHMRVNIDLERRRDFRDQLEAFYLFIRDGMLYMLYRNKYKSESYPTNVLWLLDDNLGWKQESNEFITDQAVLRQKNTTRSILQLDTHARLDLLQGLFQGRDSFGVHFSFVKKGMAPKISFLADLHLFLVYFKRWIEDGLLKKESLNTSGHHVLRRSVLEYQSSVPEHELSDSSVASAVYELKMCKVALETWSFESDYSKTQSRTELSFGDKNSLSAILARCDDAQEKLRYARESRQRTINANVLYAILKKEGAEKARKERQKAKVRNNKK